MSDVPAEVAASASAAEVGREGARHPKLEQDLKRWQAESGAGIAELRASARKAHLERWHEVANLQLESVTPIYGGGTQPGQVDLLLPFRPRAIKNSIRHWWWLLNRFDDKYEGPKGSLVLYDDMARLWGSADEGLSKGTDSAAKVRVHLSIETSNVGAYRFTYLPYKANRQGLVRQDTADPWLYALFGAKGELASSNLQWQSFSSSTTSFGTGPARGRQLLNPERAASLFRNKSYPKDLLAAGLRFHLRVEVRDAQLARTIRRATLAWQCFGGVGARTARGLGRLKALGNVWTANETSELERLLGIDRHSWLGPDCQTAMAAWERSLREYRQFRQLRHPPPQGDYTPGRSYWPKADVVRALTNRDMHGIHRVWHGAVPTLDEVNPPADLRSDPFSYWPLPEMYFGAPIIVKFVERQVGQGEPYGVELLPAKSAEESYERFPSPVLTLPWHDSRTDRWHPRIVALPYERDLQGVGVSVKNAPPVNAGGGLVNKFAFLTNGRSDDQAFIKPGSWWPSKLDDKHWHEGTQWIWGCTPGGGGDPSERLRRSAAADPIQTLFAYLNEPQP